MPPAADAAGTLRVWLMDASQPQSVIDAVNDRFAEQYPNVEVEVERQQWFGVQERLTDALATDVTPDVVEIGNVLTAKYADAGLLADLSAYAEDLEVAGMLPGLQPSGELDGVRYGIPYYGGVNVVVYNKGQFKDAGVEVPTSLAELEAVAEKLQAANSENAVYSAFYFPGRYWNGAVPFVWDAGGEIATQDGDTWTGTLDSAESVQGLTTLKGLVEKYSKAPIDADETKNVDAFKTGDIGMMIDSWWVPGILDNGDLKGDIGAFALPGTAPGTTAPVFFGGSDLAVSARSTQQALAVQWIKILTGLEAQTRAGPGRSHPQPGGSVRRTPGQRVPRGRRCGGDQLPVHAGEPVLGQCRDVRAPGGHAGVDLQQRGDGPGGDHGGLRADHPDPERLTWSTARPEGGGTG